MGRYEYLCPRCGQKQARKLETSHSAEVEHSICAACAETLAADYAENEQHSKAARAEKKGR
jgi:predicted SprT family Zn-dependent metalloprotease